MVLKEEPMPIDDDNWYYEEKKGICIVHRVYDTEKNYLRTDQFYISWKRLLESINRKYPKRR